MESLEKNKEQPAVLLIDGHCLLCSGITRFVANRDKRNSFHFAALQSRAGQKLLLEGQLPLDDSNTFVMVKDGQYFTKSEAALRVFRKLNGLWPLLYMFIFVPAAWRNIIYDWIARHRYRWFGQSDRCLLPASELQSRFLDNRLHTNGRELDQDAN
ncbi:thiol-disulfide oxidoreductase DCC family protein [Paenibacillus sp. sgz302251]|uniref:thiol-disulfide oxidoreductase DCC family protein n=1 Tax=Paenibacillus sp. sgz302251 TaxID=3414493 RepID=UPI003C79A98E